MCSDAPDTSGMNAAALQNAEVGRRMADIAEKQLASAEARQKEYDPLFKELITASVTQSGKDAARSDEQWQRFKTLFMPAEDALAQKSLNWDTSARRESAADQAGADVTQAFAQKRLGLDQALGRGGMTLGSDKALALQAGLGLEEAKATASAKNTARRDIEKEGMAYIDNAARFGRNMPSTGLQAAQASQNANQNAQGGMANQQSTYNATLAPAQGFYSGSTGATSSAGSLFGQIAQIQQQTNQANQGMFGTALGAGVGLFAASSKTLKDVEGDVDPDAALESVVKTPVKAWRYKDGDRSLRLGPMAEDVAASTGVGDGKRLDIVTELGTLRAAVQALAKDKKPRKRLSLADAGVKS